MFVNKKEVTILILIDGFLQYMCVIIYSKIGTVTILILIDGFLQSAMLKTMKLFMESHNPYFNRWFSAMKRPKTGNGSSLSGHNPYFNRWFSAIRQCLHIKMVC